MIIHTNPEDAVACIKSNHHVFIHSAAAVPTALVNALTDRHNELQNVSIYSIHTEGEAPYTHPSMNKAFIVKPFFIGHNIRSAIQEHRGSYIPCFLSEIPSLFLSGNIPLNVALISVSPPDKHGFCSLGTSVDISLSAIQSADVIVAQINRFLPRSHGDGFVHVSKIHHAIEAHIPLPSSEDDIQTPETLAIGKHIAELIEDGATLQMGIGTIPNAVLGCLGNHKNLGVHSELFSDGILPLVASGVINGSKKAKHAHAIVGTFAVGTKKLYDFMDDNPMVKMLDVSYVNRVDVIRKNPKVTAINSAIEIDLSGQVCADSIGQKMYSGVGGQMDFIRGASLSEGGKPIIALLSTTSDGRSKIVPTLQLGAGVVTTRAHVHWVVTEYGAVNLKGKTLEERKVLLSSIAHPNHRDWLLSS